MNQTAAVDEAENNSITRSNFVSRAFATVIGTWKRGPDSLFNLNAYAFGLSALFTGVGSGIMPLLVQGIAEAGPVRVAGLRLGENGAIATVSICGLIAAALVQPLAGYLSDRFLGPLGRRTTFIAVGAVGLIGAMLSIGQGHTFIAFLVSMVLLQFFGNFAVGPANALLIDYVPASRFGAAAGLLNVYKVAGAGVFVVAVFLLMDMYDRGSNAVWLWVSISLLLAAMLASCAWTVSSLYAHRKNRIELESGAIPPRVPDQDKLATSIAGNVRYSRRPYIWFLVSMTFVIAALSAMQTYSIPFLKHAVGLENPARGAAVLALTTAIVTAISAIPAGKLQDRFGHKAILVFGGLCGAFGALMLLLAHSLLAVTLIGIPIGISIGVFISVTWALANGLVRRSAAARDLGYTGVATLFGAAVARMAGPGIDALNNRSQDLGYHVMLGAIALSFTVTPLLLMRLGRASKAELV